MDTTEAFVSDGIPLENLDHPTFRNWIAGNIFGDEDLVIQCDETTDKGGNCVVNILFKSLKS
ncbi:hypothetical protein PR048_010712 [Dryococelus australis]|uniref:Uncharacterized protein n=1 Tax=Dryococelus australis TaxID=614101 RepID=A0ABQ9I3G9_9NEOP|nr:hypothetical protein PR048_010712 [Dryococelus australis]